MEGVEEVEGGAEVEEGEGSNILTSYVGIPPPPICVQLWPCVYTSIDETRYRELTSGIHFRFPTVGRTDLMTSFPKIKGMLTLQNFAVNI